MTTVTKKNIVKLFKQDRETNRLTDYIGIRVSTADKESIREAAQFLNVTMSEYLLKLHEYAISGESRAATG